MHWRLVLLGRGMQHSREYLAPITEDRQPEGTQALTNGDMRPLVGWDRVRQKQDRILARMAAG